MKTRIYTKYRIIDKDKDRPIVDYTTLKSALNFIAYEKGNFELWEVLGWPEKGDKIFHKLNPKTGDKI